MTPLQEAKAAYDTACAETDRCERLSVDVQRHMEREDFLTAMSTLEAATSAAWLLRRDAFYTYIQLLAESK